MFNAILTGAWLISTLTWSAVPTGEPGVGTDLSTEEVISRVQKAGQKLRFYQASLVYEVNQPDSDSYMVRTGSMRYFRDPNQSLLRVEFGILIRWIADMK